MQFQRSYRVGPPKTPFIIKLILLLIAGVSVFAAIIAPFFQANYLVYFLGLSLAGIKHFFIWQLITYNILEPGFGINISFLFQILFNMYLIWIIGTAVVERTSQAQYIALYLASTIFSALIMLLTMLIGYPSFVFAGPTVSLYATLIAWMMLNPPDTRIFLFFAIPLKHYWLVLGLIGFNLLANLSNMQMVQFFGYLSVSIFAYFYSIVFWHRLSPFNKLHRMERALIFITKPIIDKFKRNKPD